MLTYGIFDESIGHFLIARGDGGLRYLSLGENARELERALKNTVDEPIRRDDAALQPLMREVLQFIRKGTKLRTALDVQGTEFQRRVWAALSRIPRGKVKTYGQIAAAIGAPKAMRAVGTACGKNPIGVVIPCHRVVPGSGGLGNYHWGVHVKRRLLELEGAIAA